MSGRPAGVFAGTGFDALAMAFGAAFDVPGFGRDALLGVVFFEVAPLGGALVTLAFAGRAFAFRACFAAVFFAGAVFAAFTLRVAFAGGVTFFGVAFFAFTTGLAVFFGATVAFFAGVFAVFAADTERAWKLVFEARAAPALLFAA